MNTVTVSPATAAKLRLVLWLGGEGDMPAKGQNVVADIVHHALEAAVRAMEAYEAIERLGPMVAEKVAIELAVEAGPEGQDELRRIGAAVKELLSYPRVLMVTRTSKRYIVNRVHDGETIYEALGKAVARLRSKAGRGVRSI